MKSKKQKDPKPQDLQRVSNKIKAAWNQCDQIMFKNRRRTGRVMRRRLYWERVARHWERRIIELEKARPSSPPIR